MEWKYRSFVNCTPPYYYNIGHCRNKNNCRDEHPKRTCHEENCDWIGSNCGYSHVYDCEDSEYLKFIKENDEKVTDSIQDLETKLKVIEDKNNDLKNKIYEVRKENNSLK